MAPRTDQDSQTDATLGAGKEGTPKTFSEEEVAKLVTDAKTSALADVGRLRVEANKALTAATAAENRIKAMEQARLDAELETYRDEPDKLSNIRERQARQKAEDKLATLTQELIDKDERIKQLDAERVESTKERNAREIAARLKVDSNRLAKLARFTDGSTEAIEEIARELPKIDEAKVPLRPDSGKSSGGGSGRTPTFAEIRASTPAETEKKIKSGEWVL